MSYSFKTKNDNINHFENLDETLSSAIKYLNMTHESATIIIDNSNVDFELGAMVWNGKEYSVIERITISFKNAGVDTIPL